jgi:purine nucleoside permease
MPTPIHLVLLAAFEPDSGPIPGELTAWLKSLSLNTRLKLPAAYRPLYANETTLALATGVGAARAAASVMALGLDPRFDLTRAFFLITGVAGIAPSQGSLASVVLPEYVVDGDLTQARRQAYTLTSTLPLLDTEALASRRQQFSLASSLDPVPSQNPPQLLKRDELSSSTFFHGRLLSERATRTVAYQTEGMGKYAITAMEDTGILQALKNLAAAGRVDWNRILIVRAASNFDQQRPGLTAAESLAETKVATHSAYRPALENAHRIGSCIAESLLTHWPAIPESDPVP